MDPSQTSDKEALTDAPRRWRPRSGWRWKDIALVIGTGLFVLSIIGAAVLLGLNLYWTHKVLCSFYEGSLDCLETDKYEGEREWTWRAYTTTVGLAATGSGLIYISTTGRSRRSTGKRKALDFGACLWAVLIIAGFVCLFASYYVQDNVDPFWAWQNWWVHVLTSGLMNVVMLLWVAAFGTLFIARSDWAIPAIRLKERGK